MSFRNSNITKSTADESDNWRRKRVDSQESEYSNVDNIIRSHRGKVYVSNKSRQPTRQNNERYNINSGGYHTAVFPQQLPNSVHNLLQNAHISTDNVKVNSQTSHAYSSQYENSPIHSIQIENSLNYACDNLQTENSSNYACNAQAEINLSHAGTGQSNTLSTNGYGHSKNLSNNEYKRNKDIPTYSNGDTISIIDRRYNDNGTSNEHSHRDSDPKNNYRYSDSRTNNINKQSDNGGKNGFRQSERASNWGQKKQTKENNWRSTATSLSSNQLKAYCHSDDYNPSRRKNVFQPYISPEEIQRGIQEHTLYQGIIRLTRNRNDAYVTSDDLDADVYVSGLAGRNRSLDGDSVVVKLTDVDTVWNERQERESQKRKDRVKQRLHVELGSASGLNENTEDTVKEEIDAEQAEEGNKPTYCGEVVAIIERSPNLTYAGVITQSRFFHNESTISPGDSNRHLRVAWFKPNDVRVPFLVLRNKDIPDDLLENPNIYSQTLFSATISHWPIYDPFPAGRIIREIGPLGDLLTEKEAILADNSIVHTEFSDAALHGLPELPWSIPDSEVDKRRDLRDERIFSIDPVTAKDLDDALHIKELDGGFYEVGVHIADVGYFLKRGSALDTEAYERGTSTYLVDSVIPMLPSVLCEELCSLNPGVDRLAFSVIWKMDYEGKIVETWFGKTIIRSCAKLAYEDAQRVIDGDEISENIVMHNFHLRLVSADIFMLNRLATEMRKRRLENGSLTLKSVKLMFELDLQGRPISVKQFESKDANHLVEEFMLCANISVAKKITSVFPHASLLRKHEEPFERRLNKFLDLTEELGIDFAGNTAGELQQSFGKIKNKNVKDVLLILAIRCMQRAKYFCSGNTDISKYQHYALNEGMYTHFTSPIRRYADVIVHRTLEAALNNKDAAVYEGRIVQKMAFQCNSKKGAAKNAQDTNIRLYLAKFLSTYQVTKGPVYTNADVISIGKETYEVYVPLYGLEKKFHIEDLPTQQHYFDKESKKLDIFWKAGVPVSMHNEEKIYAQERIRQDDYSDDDFDDEIPLQSLSLNDAMVEDLVPPVVLEENTGLQRLGIFSKIMVRIQVNDERSPPIINVYPVNPFSGESVGEIE